MLGVSGCPAFTIIKYFGNFPNLHDAFHPARLQDKYHLYFLFDLMTGGDLMDVLVAEAKVIKRRIPQGTWKRACFAPKVCNIEWLPHHMPSHLCAGFLLKNTTLQLMLPGVGKQELCPVCCNLDCCPVRQRCKC